MLGGAEVAQLQNPRLGVKQNVLGLDVSVTNALKKKYRIKKLSSLFVFSIDGPKRNATSLLTPVSNIVFHALSSGTLGFALHGSFNNHLHERI